MKSRFQTEQIGANYIWMEEIDSTNEEAKRQALAGAPHGTVVSAGYQTKGRGRRGKNWESPKGENIYLSILLRPKIKPQYASMLTLVTALSTAKAIEESHQELNCQIKWPNDLVLNNKKICGILTEMMMDGRGGYYVIVGIGINVNMEQFSEEIGYMATSIKLEAGEPIDREQIVTSLLREFEKNYNIFIEHLNLKPFLEEYNERLVCAGRQVCILSDEEGKVRFAHGIDESGALFVSEEQGQMEKIISGEVSVRGLYGYV